MLFGFARRYPDFEFALFRPDAGTQLQAIARAGDGAALPSLPAALPLDPARSAVARAVVHGTPVHLPSPAAATVLAERVIGASPPRALLVLPVRSAAGEAIAALALVGPRGLLDAAGFQHLLRCVDALAEACANEEPSPQAADEPPSDLVLTDRLLSLGRISAGVGHEIANPLAALRTNLAMLLGTVERLSTAACLPCARQAKPIQEMGEMARDAIEAADRIAATVQTLKGLARERSEREAVDPAAAVTGAAQLFCRSNPGARLELQLEGLPLVSGMRGAIAQIAINLLQNGLDAMGGAGRLVVSGAADGDRVRISFADEGPGVAPDIRDRLFEPFATTKPAGTGWGLPISRQLAERMGGRLFPEPSPAGARFVLELQRF